MPLSMEAFLKSAAEAQAVKMAKKAEVRLDDALLNPEAEITVNKVPQTSSSEVFHIDEKVKPKMHPLLASGQIPYSSIPNQNLPKLKKEGYGRGRPPRK